MVHREGPTVRELLTGRESAVWRQIKPEDSRLRLIKKMAKPRGRGSKANPAPAPPLLPILGRWPRADAAAAAEKDICPHGNSRRGGGEPGSAGVTSR